MARKVLEGSAFENRSRLRGHYASPACDAPPSDANVDPMITLRATDNWIEFTVRYVVDYRKRRWMRDHLFTQILEEVDKSENRIRLASATFEVVSGSTLDVRLAPVRTETFPEGIPGSG